MGVDPRAWLTEVLRKLPTYRASGGYLDLLPGILPIPDLQKATPRQL
ncbi:MAG: transposase domain-containing protein [Akkermansia sp.]|nr:transposase domain-containing protein [Akkermansia sp.]